MQDDVFRQHAAPAIMLYRPYPPSKMPKGVSHTGGLPHLPDGVALRQQNSAPQRDLYQCAVTLHAAG